MKYLLAFGIYCFIVNFSKSNRFQEQNNSSTEFITNNHKKKTITNCTDGHGSLESERSSVIASLAAAKKPIAFQNLTFLETAIKNKSKSTQGQNKRKRHIKNKQHQHIKSSDNYRNENRKIFDSLTSSKKITNKKIPKALISPDFIQRLQKTFKRDYDFMNSNLASHGDTIRSFLAFPGRQYSAFRFSYLDKRVVR